MGSSLPGTEDVVDTQIPSLKESWPSRWGGRREPHLSATQSRLARSPPRRGGTRGGPEGFSSSRAPLGSTQACQARTAAGVLPAHSCFLLLTPQLGSQEHP